MTAPPALPRKRSYYLRIFLISFAVIGLLLVVFLFAVYMESSVTVEGVIRARDQQTVLAPQSGLIDLGWYQAKQSVGDKYDRVRVDAKGVGIGNQGRSESIPWEPVQLTESEMADCVLHPMRQSDKLYPGQPVATIKPASGTPFVLRVPERHVQWQMVNRTVQSGDYVREGQELFTIVPVDAKTQAPLHLGVDLAVPEEEYSAVEQGQTVRIYSNVYTRRRFGHALGKIVEVQKVARPDADGKRTFAVRAQFLGDSPFPLLLGSSVQVQIITESKPVYRLILEN